MYTKQMSKVSSLKPSCSVWEILAMYSLWRICITIITYSECVCEREREREGEGERESVCVCVREREGGECVCV